MALLKYMGVTGDPNLQVANVYEWILSNYPAFSDADCDAFVACCIAPNPDYATVEEWSRHLERHANLVRWFWLFHGAMLNEVAASAVYSPIITSLLCELKRKQREFRRGMIQRHCFSALYTPRGRARAEAQHLTARPQDFLRNAPLPLAPSLDVLIFMLAKLLGEVLLEHVLRAEIEDAQLAPQCIPQGAYSVVHLHAHRGQAAAHFKFLSLVSQPTPLQGTFGYDHLREVLGPYIYPTMCLLPPHDLGEAFNRVPGRLKIVDAPKYHGCTPAYAALLQLPGLPLEEPDAPVDTLYASLMCLRYTRGVGAVVHRMVTDELLAQFDHNTPWSTVANVATVVAAIFIIDEVRIDGRGAVYATNAQDVNEETAHLYQRSPLLAWAEACSVVLSETDRASPLTPALLSKCEIGRSIIVAEEERTPVFVFGPSGTVAARRRNAANARP
ncbi:ORF35 [Ranid herpesvirus 1]|uniref:ORF35 n=1 Tax=Ranid herpesvirus 1 TaxID=85655 RepID=Q14VS3_9VIRU|nr:ORF35 [Ranid herpesvirus 1]ABG25735.1 ORF35 [Ranid herpesvirus 1]